MTHTHEFEALSLTAISKFRNGFEKITIVSNITLIVGILPKVLRREFNHWQEKVIRKFRNGFEKITIISNITLTVGILPKVLRDWP